MDELRESSLLFSLESLLETERERVQREAREAERRREEELRRVVELAERRRSADEREREARQRRDALEQERSEAVKRAAIERARIEAEGQLRLAEAEQTRQHDLAIAQLREQALAVRYRAASWLSSGALTVVLMGSLGSYFGWLRPAQIRELQHQQALLSTAEKRLGSAELVAAGERRQHQILSARVSELEAALAAATRVAPLAPSSAPPHFAPAKPPGTTPVRPRHGPCPDDGDPLRPCLR